MDFTKVFIAGGDVLHVDFSSAYACINAIAIICGWEAGKAYVIVRAEDIKANNKLVIDNETPSTQYCVNFHPTQPRFIEKLRVNETALHCGQNATCIRKNIQVVLAD